ncbi:MAG: DUF1194 domain-containing protein [Beijerinckiaceae bacterium]|jgi:hypothetical protein|nr:DUF1194 domain-containing protein [Beijerinckiaceae bacterium]
MGRNVRIAAACLSLLIAAAPPAVAQGQSPSQRQTVMPTEVDVALVLAVDISFSMDLEELALQRAGYVEALRSPEVHKAIANGATGRIAISFFEWAGVNIQHHLLPWTVIDSPESALAAAAEIEKQPTRRGQRTSISGAIDVSVRQLDEAPFRALRKVMDISGDGPNNSGRIVTVARDEALRKGISINGLPIAIRKPGYLDINELDLYYEDCVIGGQGAFVIPITEKSQFIQTIKTKLIMEISDAPSEPARLIMPAQARVPRVSCTVGEDMWRNRMGN